MSVDSQKYGVDISRLTTMEKANLDAATSTVQIWHLRPNCEEGKHRCDSNKYGVDVSRLTTMEQANPASCDQPLRRGCRAARDGTATANIAADSQKYGVDISRMTAMERANLQAATSRYGVDVGAATELQRANIAADSQSMVSILAP